MAVNGYAYHYKIIVCRGGLSPLQLNYMENTMNFNKKLKDVFPEAMKESDFVKKTYTALGPVGFTAENAIACVGICRDEITQPLIEKVKKTWGEAFNFSSLAGMLFLGKTGFTAAEHHAPNEDGRERYVFYALPHIAIDEEGTVGLCTRVHRKGKSGACGALMGFQKEMADGRLNLGLDFDDVEQSLIKMKLLQEIRYGNVPDLLEVTRTALKVIQDDLKKLSRLTVDTKKNDYAAFTGIQIHGPSGNYVWPSECYAVVNGKREALDLK